MIAVAGVFLAAGSLSAANGASVVSVPRPAIGTQSGLPNFVAGIIAVGQPDPAGIVPCFNCIPGSGVVTLGLALPQSVFLVNALVTFDVTGDDLSYNGPCTFEYHLSTSIGGPSVQEQTVGTICYPSVWIANFPATLPSTPGRYFMSGSIHTGSGTAKTTVSGTLLVVE